MRLFRQECRGIKKKYEVTGRTPVFYGSVKLRQE